MLTARMIFQSDSAHNSEKRVWWSSYRNCSARISFCSSSCLMRCSSSPASWWKEDTSPGTEHTTTINSCLQLNRSLRTSCAMSLSEDKNLLFTNSGSYGIFPSLLCHCWLGERKGIQPKQTWVLECWRWRFNWSFTHLIARVVTAISIILSSNKIHKGDILVLANPGTPGKWQLKRTERTTAVA